MKKISHDLSISRSPYRYYKNMYIIVFLAIIAIITLYFQEISIAFFGMIALLLLTFVTRNDSEIYGHLIIITIICVGFMLIEYYGAYKYSGTPYFLSGKNDDYRFEYYAQIFSLQTRVTIQSIQNSYLIKGLPVSNSPGFLWFLAWIIKLANNISKYHTIIYRIINCSFLIAVGILSYKLFKRKYNKFEIRKCIIVLYCVTLFPNALYITSYIFRDTFSIFLIFSSFFLFHEIINHRISKANLIWIVLLTYFSYWVRNGNFFIIIGLCLICMITKLKSKKNLWILLPIIIIFTIYISLKFNIDSYIEGFSEFYSNYMNEFGDSFFYRIFTIPILPFGLFFRIAFGLFYPSPVSVIKIFEMFDNIVAFNTFITAAGTVLQTYCLPYLVRNFRSMTTFFDSLFLGFIFIFFTIIITTFGFRHFIMIYPFMFPCICKEIFVTPPKIRKVYAISTSLILIIGITIYYLFLR